MVSIGFLCTHTLSTKGVLAENAERPCNTTPFLFVTRVGFLAHYQGLITIEMSTHGNLISRRWSFREMAEGVIACSAHMNALHTLQWMHMLRDPSPPPAPRLAACLTIRDWAPALAEGDWQGGRMSVGLTINRELIEFSTPVAVFRCRWRTLLPAALMWVSQTALIVPDGRSLVSMSWYVPLGQQASRMSSTCRHGMGNMGCFWNGGVRNARLCIHPNRKWMSHVQTLVQQYSVEKEGLGREWTKNRQQQKQASETRSLLLIKPFVNYSRMWVPLWLGMVFVVVQSDRPILFHHRWKCM